MRLASKGVATNEPSNAAYYIAGASLFGAAAVAFLMMRKKEEKANETPLLEVDGELKAQM